MAANLKCHRHCHPEMFLHFTSIFASVFKKKKSFTSCPLSSNCWPLLISLLLAPLYSHTSHTHNLSWWSCHTLSLLLLQWMMHSCSHERVSSRFLKISFKLLRSALFPLVLSILVSVCEHFPLQLKDSIISCFNKNTQRNFPLITFFFPPATVPFLCFLSG